MRAGADLGAKLSERRNGFRIAVDNPANLPNRFHVLRAGAPRRGLLNVVHDESSSIFRGRNMRGPMPTIYPKIAQSAFLYR